MKTYKTSEVIGLLQENPKLKFKTIMRNGEIGILNISEGGYFDINFDSGYEGFDGNIKIDTLWKLVQEPIDFITAINGDKQIRSEYWDDDYYRSPIEVIGYLYNQYNDSNMVLRDINGKWYIEEK